MFGTIAATLKKARRHPNVRINDLWLAAQAVQRDLKLLTSNPKDFKDIPGLKVITLPRPRVGKRYWRKSCGVLMADAAGGIRDDAFHADPRHQPEPQPEPQPQPSEA